MHGLTFFKWLAYATSRSIKNYVLNMLVRKACHPTDLTSAPIYQYAKYWLLQVIWPPHHPTGGELLRDYCLCTMNLWPDTYKCGLHMRRECRERFLCHKLQRKPLVSDPGMHHGTCFMHVSLYMSGSLTRGGGENFSGIPGACATRNFTYSARGPC